VAPEVEPTIFSPTTNVPVILDTSRIFVVEFQVLTLPVVPLDEPVTIH
jgi:hypothetical protein